MLIKNSLIKRELVVRYMNVEKRVTALQMICWPEHDSPDFLTGSLSIESLISFVNEYKVTFPQSPVMVHCSAGLGRTGTLIAIYNIIRTFVVINCINSSYEKTKIKPFVSVFNVVRKLREQRLGMVTDEKQYNYIYKFAFNWIERNFNFPQIKDDICS